MPYLLTLFILLDTAHVLSPIVLCWSHPGLRRLMLANRYIRLPCVIFIVGIAGSLLNWRSTLMVYLLWNFWHFSMQNFGVLQMIKSARFVNLPLAFVLTTLGAWFLPLVLSVHHWVTDIGLSSRVMGKWGPVFLSGIAIASPIAFLWDRAPWLWPQLNNITLVERTSIMVNILIGFRLALGVYHFEISRFVWPAAIRQGLLLNTSAW